MRNKPISIDSSVITLKRLLVWSVIGTGISSVTTQLITVREIISQFHGNEITISLVLCSWLFVTGIGSLAAKPAKGASLQGYALLSVAIAVWPLFQILAIRGFRDLVFTHGSSPGFYPCFLYILATVSPYCLLSGFALPYAQKVVQSFGGSYTTGALYVTDNIGDTMGGGVFTFVLVYWFRPFEIIAITSALLILIGMALLMKFGRRFLILAALIPCTLFFALSLNTGFEIQSLEDQYGDILRYVESPYGRIVVTKEEGQLSFWESGTPLYSDQNVISSEEKVHFPLCQINEVGNVLLISGGLGRTLDELAKHDPSHVDYVELDPHLTKTALELGVIRKRESVEIINTDGRRYVKETKKKYDAIIVDLPDPDTFQINRFFTDEFFSLSKKALTRKGILSLHMDYAPNYISEIRAKKLSILYNTAGSHFQNVMVLPGEEAYFLCREGRLFPDVPGRLRSKGITTSYIEGFFYGNVTQDRIKVMKDALGKSDLRNTDFRPELMGLVFKEWFMKYGSSPIPFFVVVAALGAAYIAFIRKEEYLLLSTGFVAMGVEMVVALTFQIIYGYIYLQIGAIVTAFLLGLLPGALMGDLWRGKDFLMLMVSEGLLMVLLAVFLMWVVVFSGFEPQSWLFLVYCFLFSVVCGFQFPTAARIIGEKQSPAAGCLSADLTGASLGTLTMGTIVVPLWGVQWAVISLILVKVSSSIVMVFAGKGRK